MALISLMTLAPSSMALAATSDLVLQDIYRGHLRPQADEQELAKAARAVVLAANGAETPRLLLMSESSRHPDGLVMAEPDVFEELAEEGYLFDTVTDLPALGMRLAEVAGPSSFDITAVRRGVLDVVGELGLLDDAPRSATVRAIRDSTLARFDAATFEAMVARHPQLMLSVARSLLARMMSSSQSSTRTDQAPSLPMSLNPK